MHRSVLCTCVLMSALLVSSIDAAPQTAGGSRVTPPQAARCMPADLRGSFGFFRTGVNAQGPIAAVGVGQFDGNGNMVTTQSTSRNGTVTQGNFPGTYEITSDCRGVWYDASGAVIAHFVLIGGGNEFFFLSTSAGNTITGQGKRITPANR